MMHALKNPSFFRPTSRPSSPAPAPLSRPDSGIGMERVPRPLHKLSLSTFRRASPAPSQAPQPPTPLVQDGSYLEMLSLKFSEAVSRALAQPPGPASLSEQVAGKRPIPAGRGRALGALIASELQACRDNANVYRAAIRSLQRPLSVLVNNLSAHLIPLLASPAFLTLPSSVVQSLNPSQLHAFAVAGFAGEVLECFDSLALGLDIDSRGECLKGIRYGLTSIIGRVVKPLVAAIKNDVARIIDDLEQPNMAAWARNNTGGKPSVTHPSIQSLQVIIPSYSRILERCVSLPATESTIATCLISLIWHGLVALTHRSWHDGSPPVSPALPPQGKKRRTSPTTPPLTPPTLRFTMKLPPSRPPSPPIASNVLSVATDARALYDLLECLPRPTADQDAARAAREAIEEAATDLHALPPFLEAVNAHKADQQWAQELDALTEEIPTLLVLQVLLSAYGDSRVTSVARILGLDEAEYRQLCLSGFGRAEECAAAVGDQVLSSIRYSDARVVVEWLQDELEHLREHGGLGP